jgi:hypothetical protein
MENVGLRINRAIKKSVKKSVRKRIKKLSKRLPTDKNKIMDENKQAIRNDVKKKIQRH